MSPPAYMGADNVAIFNSSVGIPPTQYMVLNYQRLTISQVDSTLGHLTMLLYCTYCVHSMHAAHSGIHSSPLKRLTSTRETPSYASIAHCFWLHHAANQRIPTQPAPR